MGGTWHANCGYEGYLTAPTQLSKQISQLVARSGSLHNTQLNVFEQKGMTFDVPEMCRGTLHNTSCSVLIFADTLVSHYSPQFVAKSVSVP